MLWRLYILSKFLGVESHSQECDNFLILKSEIFILKVLESRYTRKIINPVRSELIKIMILNIHWKCCSKSRVRKTKWAHKSREDSADRNSEKLFPNDDCWARINFAGSIRSWNVVLIGAAQNGYNNNCSFHGMFVRI